ncbi:hypothetical protein ABZ636_37020 [Streptomyces sp. NPDC007251]|uniref:hypothetical protein n=1 Tax=Streptomyces sp. NPDC007251 TaxID=3154483 RepID=UPI003401427C
MSISATTQLLTIAQSRVQANYDVVSADCEYIQVKYLANPLSDWPNEHTVRSIPGVDWYALVVYESFSVTGVLAFPPDLTEICSDLGKRHPGQPTSLQFTRRNWWSTRITQTPIDSSACASGFLPSCRRARTGR